MTKMKLPALAGAVVAWCAAAAGCSDGGPPCGEVRGRVTIDGRPVKEGVIRFVPVGGEVPGSGGRIIDGRYQARVPVARQRVEVSAPKFGADGRMVIEGAGEDAAAVELIPAKYNARSDLAVDVKTGANDLDFDLTTR